MGYKTFASFIAEITKVRITNKTHDDGSNEIGVDRGDVARTRSDKKMTVPVSSIHTHEGEDKTSGPDAEKSSLDHVKKLTNHIRRGGKTEPITVRRHQGGWQVLDGHHRLQAHKNAGSKHIEVRVVNPANLSGDRYKK